jgi:iron complex transport system substrate-binding protein
MSGTRLSRRTRLIWTVGFLSGLVGGTLAPLGAFAQSTPTAEYSLIPGDPSELGAPEVPEATAPTAEGAAPLAQVLAPYADYGTDAAPGEFPRTIHHAMGDTTIEQQPVRVIVLDTGELDAMLQLGVRPVGAAEYNDTGLPAYLLEQAQGIEVVGTTAEPDLEQIVALQPDLILSSKLRHEAIYDLLAAIAPTMLVDRPGVTFKQNFVLYA